MPYIHGFNASVRPNQRASVSIVVPEYFKGGSFQVIATYPVELRLLRSRKRVLRAWVADGLAHIFLRRRIHFPAGSVLTFEAINLSENTRRWNRIHASVAGLARFK
jgi:hypothetical protein